MTANGESRQRRLPLPLHYLFKYLLNPLMRTILRSPLHRLVSKQLLLLRFTGRKSGRIFTMPVGYTWQGDDLYLMTESPWWRNFDGGAEVTVWLRGQKRRAYASVERDPLAAARLLQREFGDKGAASLRRRYRVKLAGETPTLAELQAATEGRVVVRVAPE